jgi:hypothetical protein
MDGISVVEVNKSMHAKDAIKDLGFSSNGPNFGEIRLFRQDPRGIQTGQKNSAQFKFLAQYKVKASSNLSPRAI